MILMVSTGEVRMRAGGKKKMGVRGLEEVTEGSGRDREEMFNGVNVRWRTLSGSVKDRGRDEG